jgi:hypothetical protein
VGFLFRRSPTSRIDRVLAAHGAQRCLAALEFLPWLTSHPDDIVAAWERCELPLVQAVPDCPPDAKAPLLRALENCSAACRNRDVARRIMVVRDSLV